MSIHCDGCKQKVKKLLHKIDGVFTVTIDSEEVKVGVSGNVDPDMLVKKLIQSGKHAELLSPKGNGNKNNGNNNGNQKQQQQTAANGGKGQQYSKSQNQKNGNGGGGGKDQKAQMLSSLPPQQQHHLQLLQQMKGFEDLKLPQFKGMNFPIQKDPKSAKFSLPNEDEGSNFDDDYDDDEDDDLDEVFDENNNSANGNNNAMKAVGL